MNCSTGRSSIASPRQRSSSRHGDATTIPSGRTHRSATSRRHRRQSSGPDNHPDRHPHLPRRWPRCPSCTKIETGPPYGVRPPPAWAVARGGASASTPTRQVGNANAAARVEPRREGYHNAIQIYPWSEGALYQVYAAVGQITTIALEPGESLTGAGPIAAGDTARWVIGDTESGSGATRRVHVLGKPTRPDISTNLVITTDRRIYMIELRAREALYMPAVAWAYPAPPPGSRVTTPSAPVIPAEAARNYRYGLQVQGSTPPWRPVSVFDDGRRVYVVFPRGIVQGEMPPLFVLGS